MFHTNEGHAGFLGIERIRELIETDDLSFDEAWQAVRAGTIFTTHTPVPAGIDRFPRALVAVHLAGIPGVPLERILDLGREEDPNIFNMAYMGFRLGQRANGVSRLHGEVSREMFSSLWPRFDASEVPITSITNGVHAPTWMSREVLSIAEREVGPEAIADGSPWTAIDRVADSELWSMRHELRDRLVNEIRPRIRASARQRGMAEAELGWTSSAFSPDVLTIGFARRVPQYKRLTLMLRNEERLKSLLLHPERPVQIVIAGKSHPADDGGKQLISQMVKFADDPAIRHRIAFLPDYDIRMARYLTGGVDVWLNNPLRPLEACGTSGMKAALNGALNLSIRDGWWDEWFDGENGWAIPSADGLTDPDRRDDVEAMALYDIIEHQVAPRFYDRDETGVPTRWVQMVRHTLKSLGPKVVATRMVRDYVQQLYAPAAQSAARLAAGDYKAAQGAGRMAPRRAQRMARCHGAARGVPSRGGSAAWVGIASASRGGAERAESSRGRRAGRVRRHRRRGPARRHEHRLVGLRRPHRRHEPIRGGRPARTHRHLRLHRASTAEERSPREPRRSWDWWSPPNRPRPPGNVLHDRRFPVVHDHASQSGFTGCGPEERDVGPGWDARAVTDLGVVFRPELPPEQLRAVARAADEVGLAELWLWEDCFKEGGIAVRGGGIGVDRSAAGGHRACSRCRCAMWRCARWRSRRWPGCFPVASKSASGTVCRTGWGRWVLASSPRSPCSASTSPRLHGLLGGETVTVEGRYVRLTDVRLEWPPTPPPRLFSGGYGRRTFELIGRLADGAIVTGGTSPEDLRDTLRLIDQTRVAAGRAGDYPVTAYVMAATGADADDRVRRALALSGLDAGRDGRGNR